MVIRDSSGFSVRPTTSESILNPRAANIPATRANTPGSFITNAEITCRIRLLPEKPSRAFYRPLAKVVERSMELANDKPAQRPIIQILRYQVATNGQILLPRRRLS